jgi:hypothetical protein
MVFRIIRKTIFYYERIYIPAIISNILKITLKAFGKKTANPIESKNVKEYFSRQAPAQITAKNGAKIILRKIFFPPYTQSLKASISSNDGTQFAAQEIPNQRKI